jgi:hypothetical protein
MNTEITRYIKTASDWERRYSALQLENDLLRMKMVNYEKYNSSLESQLSIQDNAILRKDKELRIALKMPSVLILGMFILGVALGALL